jgi:twitching motility two-component system response regulator PilH
MAHILIVEDSQTDAYIIRRILEDIGYKVSLANNGEQGVEKAKEILPDLILMDVVMPGLNGFQATRRITKAPETSNIPVMILSSKHMESDREWGKRQGAKEFLIKPIKPDELIKAIKRWLD